MSDVEGRYKDGGRRKHGLVEEGEVTSNEEEELSPSSKERKRRRTTSERTKRNKIRSESCHIPPQRDTADDGGNDSYHNICRHFLQGRCSWGNDCRFSHDVSSSSDAVGSGSPRQRHHSPHHKPHPHESFHGYRDYSHESLRYSSYPPLSRCYYGDWGVRGVVAPPKGIEKVEESPGWQRLRTIAPGWESDEDSEIPNNYKTKAKYKKHTTDSDSGSSNEAAQHSNKKKKISNQERREGERNNDWFRERRRSPDEYLQAKRRNKFGDHRHTRSPSPISSHKKEKILKELERVNRKIEKKRSIHKY